jgi:hypothetical protein
MLRFFIAAIIVAGFFLPAFAAELGSAASADGQCRATLAVSPDHPSLSDTVTLTLTATCPLGENVEFPPFGETLGELTITNTAVSDRQLVLTAIPKHAGKTPIWAVSVKCGGQTITVPYAELDIATKITGGVSLDDIGLKPQMIDSPVWYVYAIAAGLILSALILLWLLLRRKRIGEPIEINPLTAQEIAMQRLAALLASHKQESDAKGFFIELSDIVRWYVERLTGIRAPELTTEEFLHKIAKPAPHQWGGGQLPNLFAGSLKPLIPFLESADIVKFAKHQPTVDEMMLAYRRAEEFIQHHVEFHSGTDYISDGGVGK